MGKQLDPHHHIGFFLQKMQQMKDVVESVNPIVDDDDYLFLVKRKKGLSQVVVHLSDAYHYGQADYDARPSRIRTGAFVLIAMQHADFDSDVADAAVTHGIGVGKIRELMSALNFADVTEPRRRELRSQKRR